MSMLIIFIKNALIFKIPIDMARLFCIMRLSVCLVLVNFEFIMTEYPACGSQIRNETNNYNRTQLLRFRHRKRLIQYGQ